MEYLMLVRLEDDSMIDMKFEFNPAYKGKRKDFAIKMKNGELFGEVKTEDKTILKKIEIYKEVSKAVYELSSTEQFEIGELEYVEKVTIGLLPEWRYTKDQKVKYRTVAEIKFHEKKMNHYYIFHMDPKDDLYKIFLLLEEHKIDLENLLKIEKREEFKKYFMEKSKFRLKLMYLKNIYK